MTKRVFSQEVTAVLRQAQQAAASGGSRMAMVDGQQTSVPYPFPSPADWRDCWIYFLMVDRFNNPDADPRSTTADPPLAWDGRYDFRQGGTFKGIQEQLGYIHSLGARAIWLSPVLKNPKADWAWNYHGYGAQDFLAVDEHFGSDGTRETAEQELAELVAEAHARGIYVILDIVINHAGRVFDYLRGGDAVMSFADPGVMDGPFGNEPAILWLDRDGHSRWEWLDAQGDQADFGADDAVWPAELQRPAFFRRRGSKLTDEPGPEGFVRGDFDVLRQLVVEYDAGVPGQEEIRADLGTKPVLSVIIRAYQYLIAKYDFDGFRIDTVKYVAPAAVQTFGNAIREFALSIGKRNFFTFGEIYDDEHTIAAFVGRNGGNTEGFGIDAALDFPLFFQLPGVAKGQLGVEAIGRVYEERKRAEQELLSSHGEAGRYFVTFLDSHDQKNRFNHPQTPDEQVTLGLAILFTLHGIPCLYYGTEQGLEGTKDRWGQPDLGSLESVREALWGKAGAFDQDHPLFRQIKEIAQLRAVEPALRYGRLYFRQVSGNGHDFGHSTGRGGMLAYSRILSEQEAVIVANTSYDQHFGGWVLVDRHINKDGRRLSVAYSNLDTTGSGQVQGRAGARFWENGRLTGSADAAAIFVELAPMEVQVLIGE
ncbi:MAG: alpha-amylase family glycosyl hydrolase [Candidatus Promineifilaceae bacterium]